MTKKTKGISIVLRTITDMVPRKVKQRLVEITLGAVGACAASVLTQLFQQPIDVTVTSGALGALSPTIYSALRGSINV